MAVHGRRYAQEFKDSTIQLALNSEKSGIQIAKELGMSEKTLYGWLRDYRKKHNLPYNTNTTKKPSTTESLEEKNRHLRKELTTLKKERGILKRQQRTSRRKFDEVRLY